MGQEDSKGIVNLETWPVSPAVMESIAIGNVGSGLVDYALNIMTQHRLDEE